MKTDVDLWWKLISKFLVVSMHLLVRLRICSNHHILACCVHVLEICDIKKDSAVIVVKSGQEHDALLSILECPATWMLPLKNHQSS